MANPEPTEKNEKMEANEKIDFTLEKPDISEGQISAIDASEVFLQENGLSHEYIHELLEDTIARKKLVKKIDLLLMPLMMGTYMLQYIDKQAMSYGAVFDLLSGTHTSGDLYAWLATIFYLGYLVSEYPWSFLAQKWSVSKVVSGCVTSWGAMLMITAACSTFSGLAACRFLLGVFEAPITPCFMMIVGTWYTRTEQPFRAGAFYCCNGVGSMVGGILTYGIGQEDSFPVWRIIFILCGGVTVVWGIVLMIFLPEDPMTSKRFTNEQKAMLIARGQQNQTGILNKEIKWYQIREALLDPQVWILFFFTLLNEMINGGIANFSKLILKGVVTGSLETTALAIPQGAFQVVFILSGTFLATKLKNARTVIMIVYIFPTIIGIALLWKLPRTNKYGLLMGFYIVRILVPAPLAQLTASSAALL